MRPRIVVPILVLFFGVLVALFFGFRSVRPVAFVSAPAAVPTHSTPANVPPAGMSPILPAPIIVQVKPAAIAAAVMPATNVPDRVAELMSLAMNSDSNSLNTIWSELFNPNKDIRAGALTAVVQFGDHSVVPRLRELATQTEDLTEKAAITEAADFLQLPALEFHTRTNL